MVGFKLNNQIYDIPEELIDQFKSDNPDAVLFEEPGKIKPTPQQGAETVDVITAPDTELQSEEDLLASLPETAPPATDEELAEYAESVRLDNEARFEAKINEIKSLQKPVEEYTPAEKVFNSISNIGVGVMKTIPEVALAGATIYNKLFSSKPPEEFIRKAEKNIEAWESRMLPTGEIIEGAKKGDLGEVLAGIANVPSSLAVSATQIAAGGGTPLVLFSSFLANSYKTINEEKAKRLNTSTTDLRNKNNDELLAPLIFSTTMAQLERFGLGNITKAAQKKLSGSVMKKIANFVGAGTAESTTEIFQTALEKSQEEYGKTDPEGSIVLPTGVKISPAIAKAGIRFAEAFEEQDTWEAGIQGFLGGAGFSGAANKDVRKALSELRSPDDIAGIEKDVEELSILNNKIETADDTEIINGLKSKVEEVKTRLNDRIIKGNAIIDFASDKDIEDINSMSELAKLQVERVKSLQNKLNNKEITVEDYNDSIEGYKASFLSAKNRIKGIKDNISSKANKSAQQVEQIYQEKGKEGEAEILELYRPMAEKIADKYRNVPGFDKELLSSEILTGKRGIFDLIRSYKPEENPGVPIAAYVNKFARTRAIEAAQRVLDTEFTSDVTEAKKVTATETAESTIQIQEETKQEVKTALAEDLKLDEQTQNEVITAVEKTLGTKLPEVTDKKFKQALTKGFRTELTNTFKKSFGRTAAYESFLRDNFEKIYKAIPQETINRKFKEFNEPVIDPKTGKQKREKTAVGKGIFKKKDIAKAEFIKYFTGADVPGNIKGARKTSLAEVLADEIGLDNVLSTLSKPEVLEKFKAVQELQGQKVPDDIPKAIANVINRLDQFIEAAKQFESDRNVLRSDFGFGNVVVKGLRIFAEATKTALQTGVTIANAIKEGIQAFKEYLSKSGLTEADIEDISKAVDNISESDLKLDPESLGNKIINNAEKNSKQAIKEWFTKSIKNISTPIEMAEFLELNLTAFRNTYTKTDGFNLNTNDKVLAYIKDFISKDLYDSIDLKSRKPISIRQAQAAKFIQAFKKDEEAFIKKQHDQADYMREIVTKQVNKFKLAYQETKDENILKEAHRWFQMQNSYMDTPFRLSQKIRLIVKGDFTNYVLEHNFPGKDQVRLYMNHIAGDIEYDQLTKALNNATLDLMPKSLEYIYNQDEGMFHTMGEGFDYIKDDPKTKRYSKKYLQELKKLNAEITDLKSTRKAEVKSLSRGFNEILEKSTGVEWYKTFSPVKARLVGKGKGRKFFIPYSADDFVGLLYTTLGKGKVGDQQMQWYEDNLLRPFSRGIQRYEAAKQKALRDWMILKKEASKNVPGGLRKTNSTGFTNQNSVRLYIWNKQGMDVPGMGKKDLNDNLKIVNNNPALKEFAERLIAINPEGYPEPSKNWDSGDITTDLVSYINDVRRGEFLTEWKENVEEIFSDANKNKLRALYGERYVEALEDILHRMKTGRNRKFGINKVERAFMDWTNNSVGAIMFFNARSAVLQTLSSINFINFSDNNPINAALAFANQKQYWKDFSTLFNSDFLKQRRKGLQTDVNADEIANAAATSENKAKAVLSAILKFGFTPTQIADSFAIASGGASMYRNRIKKYIKEGLSKEEAEKKAFTDFQEIAEETQQSARPDRISMQQASSLGRLILAFGNTPMQYARLTKKAALDLINGRGDWKTNISKITYYSVIQNIIFSSLQSGLFALLFDEEDEDEEKSRLFRVGNSSIDTLLRGLGVYGAAAATVKNMILKIIEENEKSRPDYRKAAIEATSISPPINSKLRKLLSAGSTFTYKQSKEKVFTEGFSLENPAFLAAGKVISAGTNLPADRVVQKADHIYTAMQPETELWQAIALSLGWSEWDLGMIEKQTKKAKNARSSKRKTISRKTIKRKTIKR